GSGFFQDGIGRNHFPGNQIITNTEVFDRALSLRAPQFVNRDIYFAKTVSFRANLGHRSSPLSGGCAETGIGISDPFEAAISLRQRSILGGNRSRPLLLLPDTSGEFASTRILTISGITLFHTISKQ